MTNPVTEALKALKAGTGTFDEVKKAVTAYTFSPPPPAAQTLDELFEADEYQPAPNSFRDLVLMSRYDGTLTPDQFDELFRLIDSDADNEGD